MASRTLTTPASAPTAAPSSCAAGASQPGADEATATISIGTPSEKSDTSDRHLNPVDAAAVDALPTGSAMLVVQKGPSAGSRFLLDQDEVTAGRHNDSEIFLDDVTVSRRHAVFTREGAEFSVADAGSLNGTYVNRDRIDKVILRDSDEVQIGKYRLVFFSGHPTGQPSGSPAGSAPRLTGPPMAERGDTSGHAQAHHGPRMNIGQVLDELRPDFPGVTIPKIRFLEDKGLIKPERTPSGYRKFSHDDVDRLRYVLRMQRDHYLPLKVIGEHLDAIDRGLEPPPLDPVVPTVPQVALAADGLPSAASFTRRDQVRLSRKELLKIAEIDEALLDQLEQYGLITSLRGTGHYDTDALVIARTARELADFGFEPRHLRAFKTAADREVGLVEQVVAPHKRGRDAAAKARAEDTVSEIAALSVRLHATLVKSGLNQV